MFAIRTFRLLSTRSRSRLICKKYLITYKSLNIVNIRSISSDIIMRSIAEDGSRVLSPMSFSDMYSLATTFADHNPTQQAAEESITRTADLLRYQSPLRIARLIMALKNLPYELSKTESITSVINDYIKMYAELRNESKLETIDDVHKHFKLHHYYLINNLLVIPKVCHGLLQKTTKESTFSVENCGEYLTAFIDEFAAQRIASRVVSAHLMALYQQTIHDRVERKIGLFEENCDVLKYIEKAVVDSTEICKKKFEINDAPKVNIYDKRKNKDKFVYIAPHLHVMNFELLKNSMRSVVENAKNDKLADIDIIIVDSKYEDKNITIKISDIGGGIPRDIQHMIWLYGYTSAYDLHNLGETEKMIKQRDLLEEVIYSGQTEIDEMAKDEFENADSRVIWDHILGAVKYAPMFGLGYGLPVAQTYANYFGGYCKIQSMAGYGTDAYLYLHDLSISDKIMI